MQRYSALKTPFLIGTLLLMLCLWPRLQSPAHSTPPARVQYHVVSLKMLMSASAAPVHSSASTDEESNQSLLLEKGLNRMAQQGWQLFWIQGDYYVFTR